MKSKKINFKQKAITDLIEFNQMTRNQAESYYNRIYQQALRRVRGMDKSGINISREVYASIFYKGTNLFQIDADNQTVRLNTLLKGARNLREELTLSRMSNFFEKYGDVKYIQEQRELYTLGIISRKDFNERIKAWKRTNQKYIISGY